MFPSPMSAEQFIAKNPFQTVNGHIKRPSNNFIIFRKIAHDQKNQTSALSAYNERDFSKIIGRIWKNLNNEEKSIYEKLGKEVAEMHKSLHPEYKYQPKRDKAAWKHFNPEANNSNQKQKRKNNKIKQQKHQETTYDVPKINIDIPNVPAQNIDYSLPSSISYDMLYLNNLNNLQFNLFNEEPVDWNQWNMNNI
ncbi:hypothetical protein C1645_781482 [Glomus cerebriforme]|uniref:HMG box domain-containing protein n=1 Tax=Glomus cerebriforme TaxID=658196 RepID=A0A397SSH2_9GLOM|nr:hypothetical protein C1645_781482 [Glomus cerebriforme]